jgi:ADP-ribose pyrophosphatase YjhB (NUDIX family)
MRYSRNIQEGGVILEYWKTLRQKLGSQQLIIPAAAGAIFDGDNILLVKAANEDVWHLPGGIQDLNESITQTVEREIKEELGITLEAGTLISIFTDPQWTFTLSNGDVLQSFLLFFRMKGTHREEDIVLDKNEISEYGYFGLDSIPSNTKKCCKAKCEDLVRFNGTVILH